MEQFLKLPDQSILLRVARIQHRHYVLLEILIQPAEAFPVHSFQGISFAFRLSIVESESGREVHAQCDEESNGP